MRRHAGITVLFLAGCLALAAIPAHAKETRPPTQLDIGIDQHLDQQLPLDLPFVDENGKAVRLGDYFGQRPVIISLVYYECPMLCTLVLNGVVTSLKLLPFDIGTEFDVVTVSIDPGETPELARNKKDVYLEQYGREGAEDGWHFLTGSQESIDALAETIGFRYVYDADVDQYAHASGIMLATPEGRLARYFYGIDYAARDLRFALMEASANRIGTLADQLMLFCYQYDPATGTYGAATFFLLRVGAVVTLLILGTFGVFMWRRERRLTRQLPT